MINLTLYILLTIGKHKKYIYFPTNCTYMLVNGEMFHHRMLLCVSTAHDDDHYYRPQRVAEVIVYMFVYFLLFSLRRWGPTRAMASSITRFSRSHTKRRITVGRTPLDEWSARRRDLYLTTHNTNNRHTDVPPAEFEPTIPASERPQTHTVDRAANETGGIHVIRQIWNYVDINTLSHRW